VLLLRKPVVPAVPPNTCVRHTYLFELHCDSNSPVIFESPQIQGVKWPARRSFTTCAVGFGGASRTEIINGAFEDNDIGSVLRVYGNSSVSIKGTHIIHGIGGINAGEFSDRTAGTSW
jgi:hypothetical protein